MTPDEKRLVTETFAMVAPIADTAATLFYGKLFDIEPAYKALFKGSMDEQGKKLMQTLGFAVSKLDELDELVPVVEALAMRHVAYGVKAEDYAPVGEALLWTLGQGLGDDFTEEVEAAWTTVYTILADTMKAAAYAPVDI